MYYYTYLVIPTNKKSKLFGKVYFGQHRTENLNDGYIGSGKQIVRYLNKYPKDFYREIIKFYSSVEELNKAEYNLIHSYLNEHWCLNLIEGGGSGALSKEVMEKAKPKISNTLKRLWQTDEYRNYMTKKQQERTQYARGYHLSDEAKEKQRQIKLENPTRYWLGKSLPKEMIEKIQSTRKKNYKGISEETRKKRSESLKGKNKGKHKVWDNKELNIYHMEY